MTDPLDEADRDVLPVGEERALIGIEEDVAQLVSAACEAVFNAPLRRPASTTTVPGVSAAMSRLRIRKSGARGVVPSGRSLTRTPPRATSANRAACPRG